MNSELIPFNRPYMTGKELSYISEAHSNNMLAGDGPFTRKCHEWLQTHCQCRKALLTHSCTAGLDMAAMLLDIKPGDEVIMPSFTFVSTANAFVLRGGVPVFIDIRGDTLNVDETLIEDAVNRRTKAIVPVHYAGVSCDMDAIKSIADRHGVKIVEDAAQGIMASYKGRVLGSMGDLGVYSFHQTKNIISGEGGALLVNDSGMTQRAEILREKGTDRSRFYRGEVDKYTWQDLGSSYLPGEMVAAFLWAQLEEAGEITRRRQLIWQYYHDSLKELEDNGLLRRPVIPEDCRHNAHMYYVLLAPGIDRRNVIRKLQENNISAVFHYVPLHSSPAGRRYGRAHGSMENTDLLSERLIRLPLWVDITHDQQDRVVEKLANALLSENN